MKRVVQPVLLILFMSLCGLAQAACSSTSYGLGFTCIQQKGNKNAGAGSTVTATMGVSTTAGNAVTVAAFFCFSTLCNAAATQTLTFSDGASDTPTLPTTPCLAMGSGSNFGKVCVAVFCNVSATTTFTATTSASSGFLQMVAAEWTGIGCPSPFDGDAAYNSTTAGTSLTTNYTSASTDLIYGFTSVGGSPTITPGAGFTEVGQDNAGTEHEALSNTAGTNNCSASWTGTHEAYQSCMGLKQQTTTVITMLAQLPMIFLNVMTGFVIAVWYTLRKNELSLVYSFGGNGQLAGYLYPSQAAALYGPVLEMDKVAQKEAQDPPGALDV